MQRLALFDLDNTLIDRQAAFRAWAEEFVTERGLDDKALTWLIATDAHMPGPRGPFFTAVRNEFTLTQTAENLWQQYRQRMPELVSCRAEDLDALRQLRSAGWRIGIVTNGMTDNQQGKIRRTGLDVLVDAWCISDEVGIRKPDPTIFQIIAQRCGAPTQHGGWMVGDDLTLDIAGGHGAGLHTIWLQSTQTPQEFVGPRPDFTTATVTDAVQILLTHNAPPA
ncbi:putative hydrolase of the HAD superfamily [Krasilnikovia cinnamomea]|uniref:Putative hydrolase of the HAD superfamily n=1 Tax=Krasilnikovia cinnamomea TaxID=349313 RepID=A0A4Q7ZS28_9ACTN|nr:HAD family hydrolase [Krasilnikovia cinnamomea]RZU53259.1 putative hydrolase of the HAD superfamily [Krasilnikovia cinnamomea]